MANRVFAAVMLAVWAQQVDHRRLPGRRGHIDRTSKSNAAVQQQNGALTAVMCGATKWAIAFANPPLTPLSRHRNVLRSTHRA